MMRKYPIKDKSKRHGIYCMDCGAIFYIPEPDCDIFVDEDCPNCDGTLLWITTTEYPEGKGF